MCKQFVPGHFFMAWFSYLRNSKKVEMDAGNATGQRGRERGHEKRMRKYWHEDAKVVLVRGGGDTSSMKM